MAAIALAAGAAAPRADAQAPAASGPATTAPASPLKVSGSFRTRYERIDGQPRVGFNASDDLLTFRTRLFAEYDAGVLRFGGEIYDSRAYLEDAGTPVSTNEVNALEVVQAYVAADFDQPWGAGSSASVEAGRFRFNLGSRRLIADDDFRNTTNGFTGLRMDGAAAGITATLIYVLPDVRLPADARAISDNVVELDRANGDYQLFGGVATIPFGLKGAALQPTYYRLDENDQPDLPTRNRQLDTYGLRYFREAAPGTFDFDVEFLGQSGSVRASTAPTAASLDVSASYLHAEIGYRWDAPWRPRLDLEYDYVSGDKPGGKYGRFDTLFGMRRAELGPAGIYNAIGRANLSAPGIRLEIEPGPTWDAFITWKALSLASKTDAFSTTGVSDPTGASGDVAGQQVDARLRYWIIPARLRFETNFVYLAKGAFFARAPNVGASGDTKYAVIDLTLSF